MTRSILLASVLMLGSMPAMAQTGDYFLSPSGRPCAKDTDLMAHKLSTEYHEVAIGIGWTEQGGAGGVMQLFASKAGTWTMTFTRSDGSTCIAMDGDGWNRINVELPDPTRKAM